MGKELSRRELLKILGGATLSLFPLPRELLPNTGFAQEWAPPEIGLKDHTIFYDDKSNRYYLASTNLQTDHWEDRFAYAQSEDLLNWEYLGPIMTERRQGRWDQNRIWAPHVIREADIFHMFYTGVIDYGIPGDLRLTQSILHAASTNPSNPSSWELDDFVFQPNHDGMVWQGQNFWSDCRDPMVLKSNGGNHLYYTGSDTAGAIVGVAISANLLGPWEDLGSMLTVPDTMLESPGVTKYEDKYYLYCNNARYGPEIRVADTPIGPWSGARRLSPGWAHEFFDAKDNRPVVSYLTSHAITIEPVFWSNVGVPYPFIGREPDYLFFPQVKR